MSTSVFSMYGKSDEISSWLAVILVKISSKLAVRLALAQRSPSAGRMNRIGLIQGERGAVWSNIETHRAQNRLDPKAGLFRTRQRVLEQTKVHYALGGCAEQRDEGVRLRGRARNS